MALVVCLVYASVIIFVLYDIGAILENRWMEALALNLQETHLHQSSPRSERFESPGSLWTGPFPFSHTQRAQDTYCEHELINESTNLILSSEVSCNNVICY